MGGILRAALFCVFVFGSRAHAYISYSPNEHLIEETKGQAFRLFPKNELYAFAFDVDFFKPVIFRDPNELYYRYDFYHGNGYWANFRGEFKPVPEITLNLKTIITHGTSSNGPTYLSMFVPFVGLTLEKNVGEYHVKGRLSDVGRQTLGTGLFIEQKQTDGGVVEITRKDASLKMLVDGTGSYRLDGGIVAFDLSLWNQLLGTTLFFQENDPTFLPPSFVGTLYSKKEWSNGFGYGVEYGQDSANWAVLTYAQYLTHVDRFDFWLKPQFRHYGTGILGYLPGRVQNVYVAYEENDKPYTNVMDIFAVGDGVDAYSTQLNVDYRVNSFYTVYAETEGVLYQFRNANMTRNLFFRTGFKFYPFKGREDFLGVLIGDKYLNASVPDPVTGRIYSEPRNADLENKPLFLNRLYVMLNLALKF